MNNLMIEMLYQNRRYEVFQDDSDAHIISE